jgi:hypothetical protein
MLTKLAWEVESLERHLDVGLPIDQATYWATNAAITAWHLVDWAYADMTDAQQVSLGAKLGVILTGNEGATRFADFVAAKESDLHVCRAIAMTAKHAVLRPSSKARFEKVWPEVSLTATVALADGTVLQPYDLIVRVDGNEEPHEILHVLQRASAWWESFVRQNGIAAQF